MAFIRQNIKPSAEQRCHVRVDGKSQRTQKNIFHIITLLKEGDKEKGEEEKLNEFIADFQFNLDYVSHFDLLGGSYLFSFRRRALCFVKSN